MIGLLLANGCASMRHGRSQVVLVESELPGATILVEGAPAGVTPNFVQLRRRGPAVTLKKDGFLPEAIEFGRSMNAEVQSEATLSVLLMLTPYPLWAGLSLLGLTLGTDLANGAAWELPEEVGATLERLIVDSKAATVGQGEGHGREPANDPGASIPRPSSGRRGAGLGSAPRPRPGRCGTGTRLGRRPEREGSRWGADPDPGYIRIARGGRRNGAVDGTTTAFRNCGGYGRGVVVELFAEPRTYATRPRDVDAAERAGIIER